MKKTLRIGTRGSPLALIQAEEVRKKLFAAHKNLAAETEIEIVPMKTTGDWRPGLKESRFIELGGSKGLFTKEIEEALHEHHVDMAVHSMKDVAGCLPDGLEIGALLPRLDPRDAFIGRKAKTLDELPAGATVGTSSLRRQAQILARRPDLQVVPLRGNVDTRLSKLADGMADATLLAVAGMERLGVANHISSIMDTKIMLPAAGQGAIGIEIRRDDEAMRALLVPLNAQETSICVGAERALLQALDGTCQTPIGALAHLAHMTDHDGLTLEGLAVMPDGSGLVRLNQSGPAANFEAIGMELGQHLRSRMPANFFAS